MDNIERLKKKPREGMEKYKDLKKEELTNALFTAFQGKRERMTRNCLLYCEQARSVA